MFIQRRANLLRRGTIDIAPYHDHQVARRQPMLRLAEALSKQALEPVSAGCSRYLLARDGEAESRPLALDPTYQDRDERVGAAKIVLEYLLKLGGTRQSRPARECLPGARSHVTA